MKKYINQLFLLITFMLIPVIPSTALTGGKYENKEKSE
jgi:hypothetical protein